MEYLQSIGAQTAIFFRTVGFGFLLGAAYDFCRFLRLLTHSRRIAVWDVGFGAVAGVVTFLFALTQNGGRVRLYLLAAIGAGFGVWYLCASGPVRAAEDGVLRVARRIIPAVRRPVAALSARLETARKRYFSLLKQSAKKLQKNQKSS